MRKITINLVDELKGKNYEEGAEYLKNKFGESRREGYTDKEAGLYDEYLYKDDYNNYVCFTAPIEIVEDDEDIVYQEKGYWNICIDDEMYYLRKGIDYK